MNRNMLNTQKTENIQLQDKPFTRRPIWQRILVFAFGFLFLVIIAGQAYAISYKGKVYPGVFVGSLPLGGLTLLEALQTVEARVNDLDQNGLNFVFRDRTVNAPTVVTATEDPDLSYELIGYDTDITLGRAYGYGRTGSIFQQWSERVSGLIRRSTISPSFTWREESVLELLQKNLGALEHPAQDAVLVITNGIATVSHEKEGIVFDYANVLKEAEHQLTVLDFAPIPLIVKKDIPAITKASASPLIPKAQARLRTSGIRVEYQDKSWFWPASTINSLLEIRHTAPDSLNVELGISKARLTELLIPIKEQLNIEPQEPRFALDGEKVIEFKTSINGQEVSIPDTLFLWQKQLTSGDEIEILEPIVVEIEPKQHISDVNDLGITELLGVGKSNFAGSPSNRRHNIRIGAEAVNGTLIPPGEEFSLLATLGTIDGTTGYLQELVIKGNKTIPEYGGGLCQIGTTTFRGTLDAGLKITARRNHSYSVSYYYDDQGKPGTDATIYDPAPDYRFLNDTENHVLITTSIVGDELYFRYWGTNDGRKVVQSETRVWDIVPPPATRYIETLDLEVGKTKCTETPHAGIKAAFDYSVTYADGTINKETFTSQYRPWQEVCLIGVSELSQKAEEGVELDGADLIDATI